MMNEVMEELLKIIHQIILPPYEYQLSISEKEGGTFILREDGKDAICKEARLKRENKSILIYKFDQSITYSTGGKKPKKKLIEDPLEFLSEELYARRKADYLIFYPFKNKKIKDSEDKLFVFICNLKSGAVSNNADQMNAGKILGRFLAENAIRCFNREKNEVIYTEKNLRFVKILFDSSSEKRGLTKASSPRTTNKIFENFKCSSLDPCDLDTLCNKYWQHDLA